MKGLRVISLVISGVCGAIFPLGAESPFGITAMGKGMAGKPAMDKPAAEKPTPGQPAPGKQAADKPIAGKPVGKKPPADDILNRPARHHAFVFSWGVSYGSLARDLGARGKLLHARPGDLILHQAGGARFEYSFFRKSRIREKAMRKIVRDGKEKTVLDKLVLEPAEPAEAARLFAVMVLFPLPMPFHGEHKEKLMESLHLFYGKAVNVHRHYFDMENIGTQVRVYLRHYRGKPYVSRLVFSSRAIAAQRNAHILELRRRAAGETISSGPPIRKPAPVMTSESPGTARTKFVRSDKVLADTRPSRVYKLNAQNTPGMTPGSAAKNRNKNTRLITDAKRNGGEKKSVPAGRRP